MVVRTKSGERVEIGPAAVMSVRELSHAPGGHNSEIRAVEHAAALAWPGTERHWAGGWLLRAGGTDKRTNSARLLLFVGLDDPADNCRLVRRTRTATVVALPERLLPVHLFHHLDLIVKLIMHLLVT